MNVVPNKLLGQGCACSNFPGYKCITSGNLPDLIQSGDLLGYNEAQTTPQYLVVGSDINFADPNNSNPYHFAPGTQIVMLSGAGLFIRKEVVFNEANILGCGGDWSRIDVKSVGTLRMTQSSIANACTAIYLNANSKAELVSNFFANNHRCVHVAGNAQLLGEGIAHNVFFGSNYTLSCPGNRWAIILDDVPHITIGNIAGGGAPNTFTAYSGIWASNTNLDVFNSTFSDVPAGVGIKLAGTGGVFSANITGLGGSSNSPLFMNNCGIGISADNYNLSVQNARFSTPATNAVFIDKSELPSRLYLSDNHFENYIGYAVNVQESDFIGAIIQRNEFRDRNSANGGYRSGVRWFDNDIVSLPPYANGLIRENKFYDDSKTSPDPLFIQYQTFGAWLTSSSGIRLEDNYFYQNYNSPIEHEFKGIWLYNASANEVLNNFFFGNFGPITIPSSFGWNYRGIDNFNSGHNLLSCNYSENLNRGVYFSGPTCDHTDFRHNEMTGNTAGLFLSPGSIIGQQFEKENLWTGGLPAGGIAEAVFDGNPGLGLLFASQFDINESNTSSDYWANPTAPTTGWFFPSGNDPEFHVIQCIEDIDPEDPTLSASDGLAISNTFESYKAYPASGWEANLRAFAHLANHPALRPSGSPAAQFYDAHFNGNLGKLCRAQKAWDDIARFTAAAETNWRSNETAIADKLADIRAQTELMQAAETEAERQQIAQTLATLKAELTTLQQTNQSLSAQYQSEVTARANQLATDLSAIGTTDTWEQNLKTVLSLSVDKLLAANADWTTVQRNTLESIADQCRHEGGIGVVTARAAVEKFDYDDEADCPGAGLPRNTTILQMKASIAPNPASGFCRVTFEEATNGVLTVYSSQGQIVRSCHLSEAVYFDLDTQDWPNGLYFLELRPPQGGRFAYKLVISH